MGECPNLQTQRSVVNSPTISSRMSSSVTIPEHHHIRQRQRDAFFTCLEVSNLALKRRVFWNEVDLVDLLNQDALLGSSLVRKRMASRTCSMPMT